MITLHLDWREVLWYLQGGMAGSHLRWNVYEDMVNKVWPQCSEQERRNIFTIMRRDLGYHWRPSDWNGYKDMTATDEGEWRDEIYDKEPWFEFRQVLARFNPDNQYAITTPVHNAEELHSVFRIVPAISIISRPQIAHFGKDEDWESDTATVTVRAYQWNDRYYISWRYRCDPDKITKIEKLTIPDTGEM